MVWRMVGLENLNTSDVEKNFIRDCITQAVIDVVAIMGVEIG